MKLSPHFELAELTASETARSKGINNELPQEYLPRLIMVAEMLEEIRSRLKAPIRISSGYRCEELNKAVGGQPNSDHLYGMAADFVAPQFGTPTRIAQFLAPLREDCGIGQIILEGKRGHQWIHVSIKKPANSLNAVLTITDHGVEPGIHELT